MKKQTAGRDSLGNFAPKFAEINDDVLFGKVWSREDKLSLRDRSLVTICIFMGKGLVDNSLKYHLINAKNNGITKEEMDEIITHAAFYAGWLGKNFKEIEKLCPDSKVQKEMNIVFEGYSDNLVTSNVDIDNWINSL